MMLFTVNNIQYVNFWLRRKLTHPASGSTTMSLGAVPFTINFLCLPDGERRPTPVNPQ